MAHDRFTRGSSQPAPAQDAMITKCAKIDGFGVFQAWQWGSGLGDFQRYNIIYGWNYSGKTTLSRVFRTHELRADHPDYPGAKSVLNCPAAHYSSADYGCPLQIRVFNEDFVHANIRWDDTLVPVLLIGEPNIALQDKLATIRQQITELTTAIATFKGEHSKRKDTLQAHLTEKARHVKTTLGIPNYDKTKLERDIVSIGSIPHLLAEEDVPQQLQQYLSREKLDPVEQLESRADVLGQLYDKARTISSVIVTSAIIPALRDDPVLSAWVKSGIELHEGLTDCRFCGSNLPNNLLERLNNHFSDEYQKHIVEIEQHIAICQRATREDAVPIAAMLYPNLRPEYESCRSRFMSERDRYNDAIRGLIATLESKKQSPFKTIETPHQPQGIDVGKTTSALNALIVRHNKKTEAFEDERSAARNKLLNHYASEFVRDHDYHKTQEHLVSADRHLAEQEQVLTELESQSHDIEAQLSDTVRGADAINGYLEGFFGHSHLSVSVTDDSKFQVTREGRLARNLSNGERTAISFAYFVTKLYEASTELSDTIVFIDDPISSLDANHLFNVYSLIKERVSHCRQLFISTHNFEFLNLLKDWLHGHKKTTRYYLVQRDSGAPAPHSAIVAMPPTLLRFKSEYHYLFSIIHQFHEASHADHDLLYHLPNLVRRFLEAFLGFKLPRHQGLTGKLPHMFPDDVERARVDKFINHYSHNQSLPRSLQFPDLSECRTIVGLIISRVKALDESHYDALIEEISSSHESS